MTIIAKLSLNTLGLPEVRKLTGIFHFAVDGRPNAIVIFKTIGPAIPLLLGEKAGMRAS